MCVYVCVCMCVCECGTQKKFYGSVSVSEGSSNTINQTQVSTTNLLLFGPVWS